MRSALFIGRFQPLHLGHVAAIEYALKNADRLIIAVGSAEKSYEPRNPFTAGQRVDMLHAVLVSKNLASRVITITVPDVDNHELWVPLVKSLSPDFDVVYSNDYLTIYLFRRGGYKVSEVPLYRREELMATEVRRRMAEGKEWKKLVPPEVYKFIKSMNGDKLVKELINHQPNNSNHPSKK
ncbi:MAG: nicotinamide-nucleotide adenylyltransferase [Nitrososphaerota archaeon]|nr:nicotinamide-nucleotide adenylyltransferase [Nitrososphaerota archaeon]